MKLMMELCKLLFFSETYPLASCLLKIIPEEKVVNEMEYSLLNIKSVYYFVIICITLTECEIIEGEYH